MKCQWKQSRRLAGSRQFRTSPLSGQYDPVNFTARFSGKISVWKSIDFLTVCPISVRGRGGTSVKNMRLSDDIIRTRSGNIPNLHWNNLKFSLDLLAIIFIFTQHRPTRNRSLKSAPMLRQNEPRKGTFTLCPCQNPFQYPLQFPCPSHRLHWIRIPVSFRLNFMSTTASPDVKVWFCIGTCKIRMETDVRISFSRSGDRSKRNGR